MKNQDVNSGNVSSVKLIEVGVQVLSRNHDVIDCGNAEFALVPTKDFIVFLKLPKDKLCDALVIEKVRELYGRAFLAKSWWRVVTDEFPF